MRIWRDVVTLCAKPDADISYVFSTFDMALWACAGMGLSFYIRHADNGSRPLCDFGVGPASVTKPIKHV